MQWPNNNGDKCVQNIFAPFIPVQRHLREILLVFKSVQVMNTYVLGRLRLSVRSCTYISWCLDTFTTFSYELRKGNDLSLSLQFLNDSGIMNVSWCLPSWESVTRYIAYSINFNIYSSNLYKYVLFFYVMAYRNNGIFYNINNVICNKKASFNLGSMQLLKIKPFISPKTFHFKRSQKQFIHTHTHIRLKLHTPYFTTAPFLITPSGNVRDLRDYDNFERYYDDTMIDM